MQHRRLIYLTGCKLAVPENLGQVGIVARKELVVCLWCFCNGRCRIRTCDRLIKSRHTENAEPLQNRALTKSMRSHLPQNLARGDTQTVRQPCAAPIFCASIYESISHSVCLFWNRQSVAAPGLSFRIIVWRPGQPTARKSEESRPEN